MLSKLPVIIFAWLLGMLVNYLADVLPIRRRLDVPTCSYCGAKFSLRRYLIWPRDCLECGRFRSKRTWIVEIGMAVAAVLMFINPPEKLGFWIGVILLAYLAVVTVIDFEHRIIMHITSVVGGVLAVVIGISLHGAASTLIGGAFGFGVMLAIYYLGFLYVRFTRRMRGLNLTEEDAIGFGDVNLTGIMGLLLGWPGIILGLVLAILLAGFGSLIYIIYKLIRGGYHPGLALPYGPFITASIFVLLYLDPQSWFS